jgi:hypothetical protein
MDAGSFLWGSVCQPTGEASGRQHGLVSRLKPLVVVVVGRVEEIVVLWAAVVHAWSYVSLKIR